jgi:hypothetical protein
MPNDPSPTSHDMPRPAATSRDNSEFTLSIEEVAERYAKAGHPRTIRTLQRYCVSGHLDAQKIATTLGDKYLITPQSVARHIAQIEELRPLDTVATDRDQPRPVATPVAQEERREKTEPLQPAGDDTSRQGTTTAPDMSRYVALLERDNEFLRDQVKKKDDQISDLSSRFSETQTLLGAMQRMLAPLLGQGDPFQRAQNREVQDGQFS